MLSILHDWFLAMIRRVLSFVVALVSVWLTGPVWAEGRYALIIGNDSYQAVPGLEKARNDAKAIHTALSGVGFQSTLVLDADQLGLLSALSAFSNQIKPGDEAVFYFAGHGIEIDGSNYLLPTDVPEVRPGGELVMTQRALKVETVVDSLRAKGARISLLIIDACRDNPFPKEGTRSIGATRGLAKVTAPEGAFMIFSAGAGQTALDRLSNDDQDPNSVFTRILLPRLVEPGLPIHELARQVRTDVRKLAQSVNHEQFPAVYDEFDGELVLVPAKLPLGEPKPADANLTAASNCTDARADWEIIAQTESKAALESFVATYAQCPVLTAMAGERLAALLSKDTTVTPEKPDPAAPALQTAVVKQGTGAMEDCETYADPNKSSIFSLTPAQIETAIEVCRTALAEDPSGGRAGALLGRMLYAGEKYDEALTVTQAAVEAGSVDAMSSMGVLYQKGRGVKKSPTEAAKWYQAAADGGSLTGMYNLGLLYEAGFGVARDYDRAAELYINALRGENTWLLDRAKDKPKEVMRKIQSRLHDEGVYDGPVDGAFGPKTREALQKLTGTR